MPKRTDSADNHPFRRTASGFESLIPRGGSEDFFFSQLLEDPEHAAEFFEHGEDRDPLLGDPRAGMVTSGVFHVLLVIFILVEPKVAEFLGVEPEPESEQLIAELDEPDPLVFFMAEPQPQPPPVTAVPVVPAPDAQPAPPPQPNENALLIPRAMLEAENRAEIQNSLPFSTGNTDEFYTEEEVKDPGEEGDPGEDVEPEPVVAEESGEDDATSLEVDGADDGNDAVEVAETQPKPSELPDFLFRDSPLDPTKKPLREQAKTQSTRVIRPPDPVITRGEGAGGENGKLTDIRRFLAGSQFHNPEGGLVVNSKNTMYYNDQGANFVPWIRRMLTEVSRTWRAGMPWAANIWAGHVAIRFAVDRNGTVTAYETVIPSNVAGFDNIAVGAIRAADLLPLPNDYPDDQFEIILVFWYNERPYDLFG